MTSRGRKTTSETGDNWSFYLKTNVSDAEWKIEIRWTLVIIHHSTGVSFGVSLRGKFVRTWFWRFFRRDFGIFPIIIRIMKENCPGGCGGNPSGHTSCSCWHVTSSEIPGEILDFLSRLQVENWRYLTKYTEFRHVLGLYIDSIELYAHDAPKTSPFWSR